MSVEMKSQATDDSDYDNDSINDEEDDLDFDSYYDNNDDDIGVLEKTAFKDPEYFDYELLKEEDVERLLNEKVEQLSTSLKISPSLAKVLLHTHKWDVLEVQQRYRDDSTKLLVDSRLLPPQRKRPPMVGRCFQCPVCMQMVSKDLVKELGCGHQFCKDCWMMHFKIQIQNGTTTGLECMGKDCNILATEDFVVGIVRDSELRDKYQRFAFADYVKTHPELRFCPGANCSVMVRAQENHAKRVICSCKSTFCFKCGLDYHAPTQCDVIRKWLTKCADDSETANYISAHTKDCPKCHVCIEKCGGCNHMQCGKCKHDFCWMCLGDWRNHGSEYYECSRYKENPNIANESAAMAREALRKYLFYFERYENHDKSLSLEAQTQEAQQNRIQEKVMNNSGTWIDWQYLLDAGELLQKCRYTLQYTYPYAYYLAKGCRKNLFEYQQAQLEAEVENLSWKVERAEITDRGDLENQMDIAEKRRLTLLKDFL